MTNHHHHQPFGRGALSWVAVGGGLTAALVVMYVVCALAALVAPGLQASHAWLGLFTAAPPLSATGLIEGVVSNIVFAWVAATAFVPVFNVLASRRI